MSAILYKNFLSDRAEYQTSVQFWASFFDELLSSYGYTHEPYLNTTAVDGTPLRDGNPIFHAYIPAIDRAVRIIQEEPEEPVDFAAWANATEWPDGRPLHELVISLVLTAETQALAAQAIRDWLAAASLES
jgi:hypothetical protein